MSIITDEVWKDVRYTENNIKRELVSLSVDGIRFDKTGNHGDHAVYAPAHQWQQAISSIKNDWLFVYVEAERQMVPLDLFRENQKTAK